MKAGSKFAIIMVGISGSGKSTLASAMKEECNEFHEINRDMIRFGQIAKGGDWSAWDWDKEPVVTECWNHELDNAISLNLDLILSDTNLNLKYLNNTVGKLIKNEYAVHYILMDIPVDECIKRDKLRGRFSVGEDVIQKQYNRFVSIRKDIINRENAHSITLGD